MSESSHGNVVRNELRHYNRPGGGQYGNDIAGCVLESAVNRGLVLRAFNKDSANPGPGVSGPSVSSGCGKATFSGYVVSCCFEQEQGF